MLKLLQFFRIWARALRLHQWSKNTLVFVPLLMSGYFHNLLAIKQSILAFVVLGLFASATYLLNDYRDIEEDRLHWTKKNRPLASGAITTTQAIMAMTIFMATGLILGLLAEPATLLGLLAYVAITLAYSFKAKRIPLLDVTILASLYVLRMLIGALAIGVPLSPWLGVFGMFLFLSLSLAKRHTEITRAAQKGKTGLVRGYRLEDAGPIMVLGLGSLFASIIVLVLYLTQEAMPTGLYHTPHWLWGWPVILWVAFSRLWLLTWRGEMDDDPITYAITDKPVLCCGVLMLIVFVLAQV